ncbi:MAG TPA: DM13 domain-containing protein [Burkholderiales bacterium]|nr:DM13 domain-containing protein [Burkholderiales bacterium]
MEGRAGEAAAERAAEGPIEYWRSYAVTFLIGAILGLAGGAVLGVFAYPHVFITTDRAAREKVEKPANVERKALARGTFVHAEPSDPLHYGKGRVTLYDGLLTLETDFEVGPGPKYDVYLVPEAEVLPSTNVAKTMFVDLGPLRAFKGSQNYDVPAGVDVTKYGSVVVWCEQFGVLISPARLTPP